jgi:hypothetical protein
MRERASRRTQVQSERAFVLVSPRALVARINRRLADDHKVMRTARSARAQLDLGYHYTVDTRTNGVVDVGINIEEYGLYLGLLKDFERVEIEHLPAPIRHPKGGE